MKLHPPHPVSSYPQTLFSPYHHVLILHQLHVGWDVSDDVTGYIGSCQERIGRNINISHLTIIPALSSVHDIVVNTQNSRFNRNVFRHMHCPARTRQSRWILSSSTHASISAIVPENMETVQTIRHTCHSCSLLISVLFTLVNCRPCLSPVAAGTQWTWGWSGRLLWFLDRPSIPALQRHVTLGFQLMYICGEPH